MQRLTSEVTQSKFTLLNPTLRLKASASLRNNAASLSSSSNYSAAEAEMALLEDALDDCEQSRRAAAGENVELRELIAEVEEWTDRMGQLRGVTSGQPAPSGEAAYALPLAQPLSYLAPLIHSRLYAIRTSVLAVIESTDEQVTLAREEMGTDMEIERIGRIEEKTRRLELEAELKNARVLVEDSKALLDTITQGRETLEEVAHVDELMECVSLSTLVTAELKLLTCGTV